ncbi:hypothetical protein [Spirosoma endbachense]|uniref:Uncharacterized protein n=1 Tax=Spirosoma endbachense TaxID=2666025 RepID=A0A6P1W1Q7_9BACT|nr:hypothetical protein [Spirosoma endbachense]QHV97957.1 hypothetical protein GJR95_24405 [Spirosoma endbachense]
MGTRRKAQPTTPNPANQQPESVTPSEDSSKAEIKPLDAPNVPDAQIEPEGEKSPEIKDLGPIAPSEGESDYMSFLLALLAESKDPDEQDALTQLIDLVRANPDHESLLIGMTIEAAKEQWEAAKANLVGESGTLNYDVNPEKGLIVSKQSEAETEEERTSRIRANASSELDELKQESRKRQEAAEAAPKVDVDRKNPRE